MKPDRLPEAQTYLANHPESSRRQLSHALDIRQEVIREWVREGHLKFDDEAIKKRKLAWKR